MASLTASNSGLPVIAAICVCSRMSAPMKASGSPSWRALASRVSARRPRCHAGVALAAASRTMPRSKKRRACLRCSSESGEVDSITCAAASTC